MRGRLDVREIEDIGENTLSFAEVKALASGDPLILDKARIDSDVTRLARLERAWQQTSHALRAKGWMQFMPATWASYGVDGNDDGHKDPDDPTDAIPAAARYLKASGAPQDLRRAIFAYNHATWYVRDPRRSARADRQRHPRRIDHDDRRRVR